MVTEVTAARDARIKELAGGRDFQDIRDDLEHGTAPGASLHDSGEKNPRDPNIIDWDGPDDPMNPLNWPTGKKFAITATVSFVAILTYGSAPFSSPLRMLILTIDRLGRLCSLPPSPKS
jgi:hypothetical protein